MAEKSSVNDETLIPAAVEDSVAGAVDDSEDDEDSDEDSEDVLGVDDSTDVLDSEVGDELPPPVLELLPLLPHAARTMLMVTSPVSHAVFFANTFAPL